MEEAGLRGCPACSATMVHHEVENLHLDLCPKCGGVWYDAGQYTRLMHDGAKAVDEVEAMEPPNLQPAPPRPQMNCPACGAVLHGHLFEGHADIHVAACYECGGTFLDADSFKHLDARENQPSGMTPEMPAEGQALLGMMEAQRAADVFKAQMAYMRWHTFGRVFMRPYGAVSTQPPPIIN